MKRGIALWAVALALALGLSPLHAFAAEEDAGAGNSTGTATETLAPDAESSEDPADPVLTAQAEHLTAIYLTFDRPEVGAVAPTSATVQTDPAGAISTSTLGMTWTIAGSYENGTLTMRESALASGATFQAGSVYYPAFDDPVFNDGYLVGNYLGSNTKVYVNGVEVGAYDSYASAGDKLPGYYFGPLVADATTPVIGYDLVVDEPAAGATPDTTASVTFTTATGTVAATQEISVAWMEYASPSQTEGTLLGAGDTFKAGKYYQVGDVYEVGSSSYVLYAGAFNVLPAGLYFDRLEFGYETVSVNGAPRDFYGPLEGQANYELTYTYDSASQTATVTGFTGEAGGALTIPQTVPYEGADYTVTAIKSSAFYGKTGFTGTLTIPDTVTTIGSSAFNGCSNLSGTLTIPANVTSIGSNAFQQCTGFTALAFEEGSTPLAIETCAFYGCNKLAGTLTIPARATSIGTQAFDSCAALTALTFAANSQLTTINDKAFYRCTRLTGSLVLPDSVTTIGSYVFQSCYGLNGTLTLPANLESIGQEAFLYCKFTGDLVVPGTITSFANSAFQQAGFTGSLTLEEGLTTVGTWAFMGTTFRGPLTLPSTMTSIPAEAFSGCGAGGDLVLSEGVTTIGDGAFEDFGTDGVMGGLTLPSTLTTIGKEAFKESKFTGPLSIPDSVITIGEYAFSDCTGFTTLKLPENAAFTEIPRFAFGSSTTSSWGADATSFTGTVVIPSNVKTIGERAFNRCQSLGGVSFAAGSQLESIGAYAFNYCRGATSGLALPTGLTSIGTYAFAYSSFAGDLIIPDTVTSLGEYAFVNCEGFNGSFRFPDNASMTMVPNHAFHGCNNLVGPLALPANVTQIGDDAFYGCTSLQATISGDDNVLEGIETIGEYAFYNTAFSGKLTIPSSVSYLDKCAFSSCKSITELDMHQTDTVLREGMFRYCENLVDAGSIPASVKEIGKSVFQYCFKLAGDFTIPEGVETIGEDVFWQTESLTGTLTIPSTVTSLDPYALYISCFTTIVNNSDQMLDASYVADTDEYFVDSTGATVTTIGKGTYTRMAGTTPVDPDPSPVSISGAKVSGITNRTYNGKAQTQAPKVVVGGATLKSGTDYKLSYKNNVNAGTATVTMTGVAAAGYTGSVSRTFKIAKAANTLKVSAKTASVKFAKVKKAAQALAITKGVKFTSMGQGTLTYTKKSGNAKITINKKTGKITIKKGLKKGTYKVKVAIKAAGNANYNAATKTVTFVVKVK